MSKQKQNKTKTKNTHTHKHTQRQGVYSACQPEHKNIFAKSSAFSKKSQIWYHISFLAIFSIFTLSGLAQKECVQTALPVLSPQDGISKPFSSCSPTADFSR